MLFNFADDHPEHREYIISRVNAIEPDKETQLNMLAALIKEERTLIDQHLADIDVGFKDENLRCEAKELLETMRMQNGLKHELVAAWRGGPNQIKSVSGSDLGII